MSATNGSPEGDELNITVAVRCRGRNEKEIKAKSSVVVNCPDVIGANEVSINTSGDIGITARMNSKTYTVDKVFGPSADQSLVFKEIADPMFHDFIKGYNCTMLVYGMTSTGKTYTMTGDEKLYDGELSEAAGIIPRVLFKLFDTLEVQESDYMVKCSFIELYNEELKDLLDDGQDSGGNNSRKLRIYDSLNSSNNVTNVNSRSSSRSNSPTVNLEAKRRIRAGALYKPKPKLPTQSQSNGQQQQQQQQQQQSINGQQGNNHHLYPDEQNVPSNPHFRPKPVSFDPTVPRDHVKVYSRTLFVGGVPQNFKEHDIARMLRQFGEVQSVILNNARKHAFVKVYSRAEAERIMAHFTGGGNPTHGLRIRWAVGFGPRDCCDYQYGYSIIPLARLTEIDFKWSQSAEWGGTGGQPIQTNMVYEEPDIIVGEGVSSKAISQKMPTDKGVLGPKSGKVGQATAVSQTPIPYSNISPPPPPVQTSQIPNVPQIQQQYYNQPLYQQPPSMVYGQNQLLGSASSAQQQQQQQSHQSTQPSGQKSPQPPQNFDPTAQLNTLMNILNQTPK